MPRRQPFTALCQQAASLARPALADLHTHTLASDGDFTPSQIVAFAVQAGLKAVAITDHDTTAGLSEATAAVLANRSPIELVAGVEISTHWDDRDYHLLGYFVRTETAFDSMLADLQQARRRRFHQFCEQLREQGVKLTESAWDYTASTTPSLGRRHVARALIQTGIVKSHHDAFRRYLLPLAPRIDRLRVVAIRNAIELVHAAGGRASLAHPPADLTREQLVQLRDFGLDGIEVSFPARTYSRGEQLRQWCAELGMSCTGGSDCHGTERRVGSRTIPMHDLARFRQSATSTGSAGRGEQSSSVEARG